MLPSSIPNVVLPGTSFQCSRFIFGTASLFNVGRRKARLALLSAAVDAGFSHFDTAPYYGFGWAERDLGELVRARPHITVTSKVGIYSPGGEAASGAMVFMRKAAGRIFPSISRADVDFSLLRADKALDASLRRLRRECVELYMLHEPRIELIDTDEWRRWLERQVALGRIGSFGLAIEPSLLSPFLARAPDLAPIVQVLDSLDGREADCMVAFNRPLQITYGYVSAAWSRGSKSSVTKILSQALVRNVKGAIIVSTTKIGRLSQYAPILESEQ